MKQTVTINANPSPPLYSNASELVIVDLQSHNPKYWTTRRVDLTGLATLYPGDPEPEYVDINDNNIAVVTLQENNHIVLVNLESGSVVNHFTAGSVNLVDIDTQEEDPAIINQTESVDTVLREPDGVAWIDNQYFATADEGDLNGGSRSVTIFDRTGDVIWNSNSLLDHWAAKLGHYPDDRSGNKGNEPENVEVATYNGTRYLFVNSERSSLVFVFNVNDPRSPRLVQTLPAGAGPEGGLAIPHRKLLVVASEVDDRGDKLRSVLNIYKQQQKPSSYPTLLAEKRSNGLPIPWGALSSLTNDLTESDIFYSVDDSFYGDNRIFKIDASKRRAKIVDEIIINDQLNILASLPTSGSQSDPTTFDDTDLAAMINSDKSVNIDAVGISQSSDGGFWIVSEGSGSVNDTTRRPIRSLNLLIKTDPNGTIERVITLPDDVNNQQIRFGFEGVAESAGKVLVAFQRAWIGETHPRIGIYDLNTKEWSFVFYPLEEPQSQNGGWVGLSDLAPLEDGRFLVIERDNQGGPDAAIKRIYEFDITGVAEGSLLSKKLIRDLMPELIETNAPILEKIEGLALNSRGKLFILNDNDGVDDNSGETWLMKLRGKLQRN